MCVCVLQRKHERSSLFNLNDEEEEEGGGGLTHYGRSLSEMDKFDDPILSDEETQEGEDGDSLIK